MKCQVCGGKMKKTITDLPFKVQPDVIVKSLPVLQCDNCREYLIEDSVMAALEGMLNKSDSASELEVVRFAA